MLDNTLVILLAGGIGSRLAPLTNDRTKPAVPFGGKYRIIDFTLSNCLHSGLRQILVLTQYKSHSLQKHLRDGWSIFNAELGEFITPVPPQMRAGQSWYTGTANAIQQNRYLLERNDTDSVLILSGDHIYRMDYAPLIDFHCRHGAAATVACMDVDIEHASDFGVMTVDPDNRITAFVEKPEEPAALPGVSGRALVSMGIYAFATKELLDVLDEDDRNPDSTHDFGRDILPRLITERPVYAHQFGSCAGRVSVDRYWRDVGTLDAYYEANMDLLHSHPPIDLYQEDWPIRTYSGQHPPARTVPGCSGTEGLCLNSIVASGVIIAGGGVEHSILFARVFLDDLSTVKNSILFDHVQVGKKARIRNCIIDKNVVIPANESIGFDPKQDRNRFHVTSKGIVVVPKEYQFDNGSPS